MSAVLYWTLYSQLSLILHCLIASISVNWFIFQCTEGAVCVEGFYGTVHTTTGNFVLEAEYLMVKSHTFLLFGLQQLLFINEGNTFAKDILLHCCDMGYHHKFWI